MKEIKQEIEAVGPAAVDRLQKNKYHGVKRPAEDRIKTRKKKINKLY